ncbi:MAG: CvpA family protein [Myxococcales bacterium]|jgi:uncharacterized membrane protein required for colicin V production|nr:CvpA family protein [Myxococcales bacterium]
MTDLFAIADILTPLNSLAAAPAVDSVALSSLFASRIDAVVLAFALLIGAIGLYSGAIKQIANIAGLVVGYFAARPVGARLSPAIAGFFDLPLFIATIGTCLIAFFALYALSAFLLKMILKRLLPAGEGGLLNRLGGFVLGVLKAALLAFVVLSGVALVEPFVTALWSRFPQETRISRAYGFARQNSIFARLSQFETLRTVVQAGGNPNSPGTMAALEALANDPSLMALANDPRIASIAADPSVQKAIAQGNYAAIFSNKRIQSALNDPELFDHLGNVRSRVGITLVPGSVSDAEEGLDAQRDAVTLDKAEKKRGSKAKPKGKRSSETLESDTRSRDEQIDAMQEE